VSGRLKERIRAMTGVNVARCYQCGKCSAGCPMAAETTIRPHDVMRFVMQDRLDRFLGDDSIWLCVGCETCTQRCPNECDPAKVTDAVREIVAGLQPDAAPRPLRAFHEAFLRQIERHGRLGEMGLIMGYKFRSGRLFSDVGAAPGMMSRGKLAFLPKKVKGLDEIRRIFAACRYSGPEAQDAASNAGH